MVELLEKLGIKSIEALPEEHEKSVEGKVKDAAGYVKEEAYEHGDSPEAKRPGR